MKTKTSKTAIARPRRSLLQDIRGQEFVQVIIITVALALAGLAAVQGLSGAIGTKMGTTGEAINALP
jgi:hypothetical protein